MSNTHIFHRLPVEILTLILRSTEVDREPFTGTTFPRLKTLAFDVWDGYDLREPRSLALDQRGIMAKLQFLEIPAALLDAVHSPNVESVVIRIYRDTDLPSILRSLQEWKSLRCLRLHASAKDLAPTIIKIIQALIESIEDSSSSTRLPSLKCLLLTYHHQGDPINPDPLGFLESDPSILKLFAKSLDARRYRTIDEFKIVNQWALTNEMDHFVFKLLVAHRVSVRRGYTEEERERTDGQFDLWTHWWERSAPPVVALNDEEEEEQEEGAEADQTNRRRSLSFRRAESDPGPITSSSSLED